MEFTRSVRSLILGKEHRCIFGLKPIKNFSRRLGTTGIGIVDATRDRGVQVTSSMFLLVHHRCDLNSIAGRGRDPDQGR